MPEVDDIDRACAEVMADCACEGLRRTARMVTSLYQETLAGTGVRVAQLSILVAARLIGPVPVTTLADTLAVDRTTLTRNLASLADGGFVRTEEGEDRRVRLVALTPKGTTALEGAIEAWRRAQGAVAAQFGPARLEALVLELAAFTEAMRA